MQRVTQAHKKTWGPGAVRWQYNCLLNNTYIELVMSMKDSYLTKKRLGRTIDVSTCEALLEGPMKED